MATETRISPRFTVDPREGTVIGPGGSVRLEPKVMEVLAELSRHAGRVVSRDELLDAVWPDVIVTEQTLSRCIYELRRQLGRISAADGHDPYNPIETLPKRGYRLVARLDSVSPDYGFVRQAQASSPPVIPYVVGQWVRGDRFYGRSAQLAEILEGHRNCIWLLGTRRIGKTSLLKQIELMAATAREPRYFPVFWDFQGADTAAELHLNFNDAVQDAGDRLERIGIEPAAVEADDLFASLEILRRRLREKRLALLLLCDEVEELINLRRESPSLLRKLRHAMQSRDDIRTVLASTIRLWALNEQDELTSPFLHGFTPPLYIERFSDDEARSLIEQSHLDPGERPRFDAGVVETIRAQCDNHPYLIQLVCKRFAESGDLEWAIEQVATDRMVSYFFSVDFGMLSEPERAIVRLAAARPGATSESIRADLALSGDAPGEALCRLENLGYLRGNGRTGMEIANAFFRRWLRKEGDDGVGPAAVTPAPVPDAPKPSAGSGEQARAGGLFAELRRRSVFRVGFAYTVAAWLLLQIGDIVFDFLEVPTWAGKLLIAFLALGLPVALILAWAYELTPEGVKPEREVDRSRPNTSRRTHRLEYLVIAILALALVVFALDRFAW